MNTNNPRLDFKLVIEWEKFKTSPFSFWISDTANGMEEIIMRILGLSVHNPRFMLSYNGCLFPINIRSRNTETGQIAYTITLWENVREVHIITIECIGDMLDTASLKRMDTVLKKYIFEKKVMCTICNEWLSICEGTFYPFAGMACNSCKEANKIPFVNTD